MQKKRRSLSGRAQDEQDPEWRRFFLEVENRRKLIANAKKKTVVFSQYEKDGQPHTIARQKSDPALIKKLIKLREKKAGSRLSDDLLWLRSVWPNIVDAEVAADTEVFAFKNGVVTIVVFSSVLLQEIRQFHQDAILHDLRDIWQGSVPLLKVQYRTGKRS